MTRKSDLNVGAKMIKCHKWFLFLFFLLALVLGGYLFIKVELDAKGYRPIVCRQFSDEEKIDIAVQRALDDSYPPYMIFSEKNKLNQISARC